MKTTTKTGVAHEWGKGSVRSGRGAGVEGWASRVEKNMEAYRVIADVAEAAEAARLAIMPAELSHGDFVYRREGASVSSSYQGGEFTHCYHIRVNETFGADLVAYLSS